MVHHIHLFYYSREDDQDPDVLTLIDIFDHVKADDEEQLPGGSACVDLTSPEDVFHAVFKQVKKIKFLKSIIHSY